MVIIRKLKLLENYIKKNFIHYTPNQSYQELGGVLPGARALVLSALYQQSQNYILAIAPNKSMAYKLWQECKLYIEDPHSILFFPAYENLAYSEGGIDSQTIIERQNTLDALLQSKKSKILVTSSEAFLRKLPPKERFYENSILIKKGIVLPPSQFVKECISLGYEKKEKVEGPGEIAWKGEILDIFPVNSINGESKAKALRIEYFDDEIENIRLFFVEDQKSLGIFLENEFHILPTSEVVLNTKESQELLKHLQQNSSKEIPMWAHNSISETKVISQLHHPALENLYPLLMKSVPFYEYFPEKPIVILSHGAQIREDFARIWREFNGIYKQKQEEYFCLEPKDLLINPSKLFQNELSYISFQLYALDKKENKKENKNQENKSLGILDNTSIRGKLSEIREKIWELIQEGYTIVIATEQENQLRRIHSFFQNEKEIQIVSLKNLQKEILKKENTKKTKKLYLLEAVQESGFSIPELKFYLITDTELFGKNYKRKTRSKRSFSNPIASFLDLREGSYVVHLTHGIGCFLGLEKVKSVGKIRDFLVIEYADQDKLYVPLSQISLVQQYLAPTEKPKLDSLGKASFKKVKDRVQEKVEELAQELIRMQAIRDSQKGFAFPKDTPWQADFETEFPYEESQDQITAIEEVKEDMMSSRPMDRLVCGDVGYGKTEIAIRAIFKAVLAGKQVAFIAPTTILAFQHFYNLKERYKKYPIRIDWISRFRSAKEIRMIKENLEKKEIDVIIGTHALLSPEIKIKNLGLLVIDEEQRFGVNHKEAIKRLRNLVDVLTLSATPIPRTLHMSLVGIRDLSIIKTPPQERLPVQTYVMEQRDNMIRDAILKEMKREGQIFFLHNRVASIETVAEYLGELIPEASLSILHGQMIEGEIEDTLLQFQKGKTDILVSTSIIENGIDMPNVNTLIVDRAELFGLSQLYQIRGRVGRSNRQAYAYFLYPPQHPLSETAQKRLNTILENQELGSGFKIAMRDLEIRGAGNILGRNQSGHIIDVGYELYLKLLEESLKKLKNKDTSHPSIEQSCVIQLDTDFYIPETYITDVRQRIEFYKRFEACQDIDEVAELTQEMKDRFGEINPVTEIFIQNEKIRALASQAGFVQVQRKSQNKCEFLAGINFRVKHENLLKSMKKFSGLSIRPSQKDTLFYQASSTANFISEIIALLNALLED